MKEYFRAQEALIAYVHCELFLGDGVDAGVLLDVLFRLCIVPIEFLGYARAHVTVSETSGKFEYGWIGNQV